MYVRLPFEYTTTLTLEECIIAAGKGWRIGHYFPAVVSGSSANISFHTPAGKKSLYSFADIGKTGGTISLTLIEGGTISGGTAITPWNLNRNPVYANSVCTLTNVKYDTTVSGGIVSPPRYAGGEAQGNQNPGGSSTGAFVYLAPDTDYTIAVGSLTSTTAINLVFDLGVDI